MKIDTKEIANKFQLFEVCEHREHAELFEALKKACSAYDELQKLYFQANKDWHKLDEENKQLRKENEELKRKTEWQPIETAPKDELILCFDDGEFHLANFWSSIDLEDVSDDDGNQLEAGFYVSGSSRICDDFLLRISPTHWMPLPTPPKDDSK